MMSQNDLRYAENPPSPTSPAARQAVLDEADTERQATLTAYMSGYFEGEGCVAFNPKKNSDRSGLGFHMGPSVSILTAQMAGLFDGEGSIFTTVGERESGSHGHKFAPVADVGQNEDNTILEELFEDYCSVYDVDYNVSRVDREDKPAHSPFVRCYISRAEEIKKFLEPMIPLLREKRKQAVIMVDEILPRYQEGRHLNKRGFLELMSWKEKLDKSKPMDNSDRKYTYDYFAHELGWLQDVEEQKQLDSWE